MHRHAETHTTHPGVRTRLPPATNGPRTVLVTWARDHLERFGAHTTGPDPWFSAALNNANARGQRGTPIL